MDKTACMLMSSTTGESSADKSMVSEGDLIMGIRIRFPLRISCIQREDELALKRESWQGKMSCTVSGVMIGLVERNEEYQESSDKRPKIRLA